MTNCLAESQDGDVNAEQYNSPETTFPEAGDLQADELGFHQPERSPHFLRAKRCIQAVFGLLVLWRVTVYLIANRCLGRRAFLAASESIAGIPGIRGVYLRQAFYRRLLARCGQDSYFGWNSVFSMVETTVGSRVYIGRFCSMGYAHIEDDVMLSDGVQILSGGREHGHVSGDTNQMRDQPHVYRRVTIGRGAWIGARAVVMADVGAGAIVGAGAVVNKPVPPRTLVAGVPAVVKKTFD